MLLVKAAVMGVVEGLTEFLPISSTGHLILAGSLLNFTGEAAKVFEIAIQTGAMFAVVWEYRARLGATLAGITHDPVAQRFVRNLLVAFLPAAVLGLLFSKAVKAHLFHPVPVAAAFIVGGVLILVVEAWHRRRFAATGGDQGATHGAAQGVDQGAQHQAPRARIESVDQMGVFDAFKVGCMQCLALIPGTSRSGATIIGAMVFGFSRRCATEFSFYLGIPTLMAAGAYSVWKERAALHASDLPMFAVGLLVSCFAALLCIRWLIRYVSTHDFTLFAWYRIVFGCIVLATAYGGLVNWSA